MYSNTAKSNYFINKYFCEQRKKTQSVIMPCWYYEKKELRNTPSIQDGIDFETECRYRKEGARFIIDTGTKMDLGYNTMATGVVYFHRFYMFHSFRNFPRYVSQTLLDFFNMIEIKKYNLISETLANKWFIIFKLNYVSLLLCFDYN